MRSQVITKREWLIRLGSLAFSTLLFGLSGYFIEHNKMPRVVSPTLPQMRVIVTIVAIGALLASVAWLHFSTLGKMSDSSAPIMTPGEFHTRSLLAMTLAETCSVCGLLLFFEGDALRDFAPYIGGTLLVFLLVILPKGLLYFEAWDASQRPKPPSPFN